MLTFEFGLIGGQDVIGNTNIMKIVNPWMWVYTLSMYHLVSIYIYIYLISLHLFKWVFNKKNYFKYPLDRSRMREKREKYHYFFLLYIRSENRWFYMRHLRSRLLSCGTEGYARLISWSISIRRVIKDLRYEKRCRYQT